MSNSVVEVKRCGTVGWNNIEQCYRIQKVRNSGTVGNKVEESSGIVEQCGGGVEVQWCGTVWWNSVEQYGITVGWNSKVEHCGTMWWNSETVWNSMVKWWDSTVEQCGTM